jgi:RNA polymerase sigma-70 factor (ECF subfamily)
VTLETASKRSGLNPKGAMSAAAAADVASLTAGMARGDEAAYRRFYGLYFSRLLRYLLVVSHGRVEAAREALQLTLVRVARHARRFDSEEAFWSWLTVLARSAVVDEARKSNRYLAFLDRFFHRAQTAAAADTSAEDRLRELLDQQVKSLPWDERELIENKYFSRETVRQIATRTGATEKAVESELGRVRSKLRERILDQLNDENRP